MEDFRQWARVWLVPAGVAALVFFFRLGATRLWDRDEPRNAQCAWEMLQRNDWVVPTFNGELRGHKPVLLYWLMMVAYTWLGKTEFAARFWSALLSVGTCILTADLVGKATRPSTGIWAGTILASSLLFVVAARAATPDAVLMFFTTAALWWFAQNVCRQTGSDCPMADRDEPHLAAATGPTIKDEPLIAGKQPVFECPSGSSPALPITGKQQRSSHHTGSVLPTDTDRAEKNRMHSAMPYSVLVVFYALLALAVLAKGPVGMVLPAAIVGAYLLWHRCDAINQTAARRSWARKVASWLAASASTMFQLRPVLALAVVLAVAGPWYAWVGWRTAGRFLYEFFVEHNLNRACSTMEGHSGPFWYYIPAILVGFFPWSIFFLPTLLQAYRELGKGSSYRQITQFLLSWLVVWVSAFSIAQTKLPSYVTPAYPALAGLTAIYLDRWRSKDRRTQDNWMPLALVSLGIVGGALLIVGMVLIPHYFPGERLLAAIGLIPLLAAALAGWAYYRDRRTAVPFAVLVGAIFFCVSLFSWAAPRIDRYRQFDRLLTKIVTTSGAPQLAVVNVLEPSWVFYFGGPIKYLTTNLSPSQEDSSNYFETFLGGRTDRFIITTGTVWKQHESKLSANIAVLEKVPYFLEKEELVLLGRRPTDGDHFGSSGLEAVRQSGEAKTY